MAIFFEKPHRYFYICVLFQALGLLLSTSVFSQSSQFKNYSSKDGLPSSEVYHAMQDSKGYMWFSTDRGVSRFNGYEFKTFTTADGLADNTVFECIEDYKGRIWFRSFSGRLSYYFHDSIFRLPVNDSLVKILHGALVTSLHVEPSDKLYIATYGLAGIIKIDLKSHSSISFIPLPHNIFYIGIFNPAGIIMGNVWKAKGREPGVKDRDSLVSMLSSYYIGNTENIRNGFSWRWNEKSEYQLAVRHKAVKTGNGIIAVAVSSKFMILDKDSIKFSFTFNTPVLSLTPYREGVWIIRENEVPVYYKNGKIIRQPCLEFLKDKHISSMAIDSEGGLWFTSLSEGVYYLSSLVFKTFNAQTGLPGNKVNFISPFSATKTWILAANRIVILSNDSILSVKIPDITEYTSLTGIFFNTDGTVWIGGYPKMLMLESPNSSRALVLEGKGQSSHLAPASGGKVWASVDNVIRILDRTGNTLTEEKKNTLNARILALSKESGQKLWLGTLNGLWEYSNDSLIYYGSKYRLLKNRIEDIKNSADGNLWLATRDTGIILKSKNKLYHFTTKDGLPSNFCKCLCIDYKGNIWVGTNKGLSHIFAHFDATGNYIIDHIKNINGPALYDINCIACFNNMVYAGTNSGLTIFDMDQVKPNKIPPPVYITDVSINNKASYIPKNETFNLHYNENDIVINYAGLTYIDAGNTLYRYKMQGIDTGWFYTKNRNIQYAKLPPGDYKFIVNAMNNDGVWSASPASIGFIISPPFWATWWARTIVILLAAGFMWWQIKRVVKRERRKTEINKHIADMELKTLRAQMNPHFLFNSLNTLTELVESKSDEAPKFVNELSKFYRQSLQPGEKEFRELQTEVKQAQGYVYMLNIRFSNTLNITWDIDKKYLHDLISTNALQLLIENITKHNIISSDNPMQVEIRTTESYSLIIKNKLLPRHTTVISTGHGLNSINERYRLITGKIINITRTAEYFLVELPLISPKEYENTNH